LVAAREPPGLRPSSVLPVVHPMMQLERLVLLVLNPIAVEPPKVLQKVCSSLVADWVPVAVAAPVVRALQPQGLVQALED
jgi:hypothetical protein